MRLQGNTASGPSGQYRVLDPGGTLDTEINSAVQDSSVSSTLQSVWDLLKGWMKSDPNTDPDVIKQFFTSWKIIAKARPQVMSVAV